MNPSIPEAPAPRPPTAEDEALLEAFRQRYPFALDPFQEQAIRWVLSGESVLVSAPTGAGKTLIAEFAIYRALAAQRRIIYTTPLKALSNQKYGDFIRQYGGDLVGILTGDVKVNSGAPILVMTTEILRNLLFTERPQDIATAVLDECHYLGDEGRGTVWEEIVINAPPTTQLVGLSATVSNLHEIAAWIGEVHRPIHPIVHTRAAGSAPVPPLPSGRRDRDAGRPASRGGARRPGCGFVPAGPGRDREAFRRHWERRRPASPNRVVPQLRERRWLPAIYFIFSRAGCERALRRYLEDGDSLLPPERRAEVDEAIANTLRDYPSIVAETEVNALLFDGLRHGAGMHHAGILPALKRLTEVLFERGLVKVVFATETMSLGIHMPARSVVIQGVRKRSEAGFRRLSLNELTQMAGRAGRRGIDPEGKCLIALDSPEAEDDDAATPRRRARADPEPVPRGLQLRRAARGPVPRTGRGPPGHRVQLRPVSEPPADGAPGGGAGGAPDAAGQGGRHRVAVLHAGGPAALSGAAGRPGGGARAGAAPGPGRERQGAPGRARRARPGRKGSMRPGSGWRPWRWPCPRSRAIAVRTGARRSASSSDPTGSGKPWRSGREACGTCGNPTGTSVCGWWKCCATSAAWTGPTLTPMGRLIASLRHDNELLVARVAFSGLLDGLPPAETAALLACVVEEPRETETLFARQILKRLPHLRRRVQALESLAAEVDRVQQSRRVFRPVSMHTTYLAATYEWAAGEEDWIRLIRNHFGGHEGDLIRAFRRLIDLCRQLAESPELPAALQATLRDAVKMLDRGIVLESALI